MTDKHEEILTFIARIRQSHPRMVDIFTKGSCFYFYLILKHVYPEAIYYDDFNHVITRIDDKFYDITGEVSPSPNHDVRDEDFYANGLLHFGRQDEIVGYFFRGGEGNMRGQMADMSWYTENDV